MAEYCALASTASEIIYIRSLFHELGIPVTKPPCLFCDNIGATQLSLNLVLHSRIKHIAIDLHFVYDLVSKGMLQVSHVSIHDQLAYLNEKNIYFLCIFYNMLRLTFCGYYKYSKG